MNEDFLHYVWQYKKFSISNLTTVKGENLTIVNGGLFLRQAGPDFFNAQIVIENQKWAGNIEIHVKSSDWYLHHHEKDPQYDNVILHVVWEHDVPVFRKDNSEIPVLELKTVVSKLVLNNFLALTSPKSWIYCENQIKASNSFIFQNWMERLFFERLERKTIPIKQLLEATRNDWESVLFCLLAKNFGLNTNGDAFFKLAQAIPFSIIRKESCQIENLEAILFGMADLIPLEAEDFYSKGLSKQFNYMIKKYKLAKIMIEPVQFFKHRPDNFPTIRLAQMAMLYHVQQNLFSKIIAASSLSDFYQLFTLNVSEYWQSHYQFDKDSPKKKKQLSKSFIDLLIMNSILPLQFAYAINQGKDVSDSIINMAKAMAPEKNTIVEKFSNYGVIADSAFETQSLLQLKNEYCNPKKCLQCAIGIELLKT